MKKALSTILGAVCIFAFLQVHSQDNSPKWKIDLENKASWSRLLPTGNLLVTTNLSLYCVNPETQQVEWQLKDIGEVNEESFVELEGTPFAMFECNNPLKSLKSQTNIIDFSTGRIIFNTKEANMAVLEKTLLLDIGAILLELKQDKKVKLALIDIGSGSQRWITDMPDRKTGVGLGALKQAVKSALDASPVTDLDGNILFPDDKILKKIDGGTGKILWQVENEKSVGRLNFSEDGSVVYLGAGRKITALTVADGKEVWKDPFKISGEFKLFIPSSDNQMYVVTSGDINKIDKATGKSVWKKPYTFANYYQSLRFTKEGILIFSGNDKTSAFDYITFNGTSLWKRAYTTDMPVVDFNITPKGILFASAEEANMIDLKTGDDSIWKKRIKLKGRPVTYFDETMALVYAEKRLYRINMENLAYELLNEEIKFQGGEDADRIEVLPSGYLLSSQQNLVLIKPDGKIGYSTYYKPASLGGTTGKILGAVAKVYVTMNTLEATQDPNAPNTVNIKRSEKGDEMVGGINEIIATRKKSFQSQTSCYMMTRLEENGVKKLCMVKVDKATGKEIGRIRIKNMDPMYQIDEASGSLFIISNEAVKGCEVASFGL